MKPAVVFTLPADSPFVEPLLEEDALGVVVTDADCKVYAENEEIISEVLTRIGVPKELIQGVMRLSDDDWWDGWQEGLAPRLEFLKITIVLEGSGENGDLVLSPGRTFGVGHHPTTALLLELLCDYSSLLKGKTVLDFGCGSGVLGIAALRLGARKVYAIDIDDEAKRCARENANRNGYLEDCFSTDLPSEQVDIVLVNVLLQTQRENAKFLQKARRAEAVVFSSGFLAGEEAEVCEVLGLKLVAARSCSEWAGIIGENL